MKWTREFKETPPRPPDRRLTKLDFMLTLALRLRLHDGRLDGSPAPLAVRFRVACGLASGTYRYYLHGSIMKSRLSSLEDHMDGTTVR